MPGTRNSRTARDSCSAATASGNGYGGGCCDDGYGDTNYQCCRAVAGLILALLASRPHVAANSPLQLAKV